MSGLASWFVKDLRQASPCQLHKNVGIIVANKEEEDTLFRVLVLPKQLLGNGYIGWCAIAFAALFVCSLSF